VARDEPLAAARLRTGGQLSIVNASSLGVLAETTERLLPGRHLDVHVVSAEGRVLVRARVARASVSQLAADAICYQAALAFDRALDVRLEGYAIPVALRDAESHVGSRYPVAVPLSDIEFSDRPSA
jgi:hypothetical protein